MQLKARKRNTNLLQTAELSPLAFAASCCLFHASLAGELRTGRGDKLGQLEFCILNMPKLQADSLLTGVASSPLSLLAFLPTPAPDRRKARGEVNK